MKYSEFIDECREQLEDYMRAKGEQVDVLRVSAKKVNSQEETLNVHYPEGVIAPVVYMSGRYNEYLSGKTMQEIVQDMASNLQEAKEHMPNISELTRENADTRLYMSLMNSEMNSELLENVPHRRIEDLACVAKFRLGEEASVIVNHDLCAILRMTSEEVLDVAEHNMICNGYQCEEMDQMIKGMLKEQGMGDETMPQEIMPDMSPKMYVATTENHVEGAAVIASKEVMREMYQTVGEPFYILPSSRHEVIFLPDSFGATVAELSDMVKEVNRNVLDVKDVLSDHIYHFDGRKIELADGIEKTKVTDNKIIPFRGKSR